MLTVASSDARDEGKFTRQFCRCTNEISAAVDCAFFLGAISPLRYVAKAQTFGSVGFWELIAFKS